MNTKDAQNDQINLLFEELSEQYGQPINLQPCEIRGFKSYQECFSRAIMSGMATFGLGFGGCYFAHHLLSKSLPYGIKGTIAISSTVAVLASYKVASVCTQSCLNSELCSGDTWKMTNKDYLETVKILLSDEVASNK